MSYCDIARTFCITSSSCIALWLNQLLDTPCNMLRDECYYLLCSSWWCNTAALAYYASLVVVVMMMMMMMTMHGTVGGKSHQLGESGSSVQSAESSLWPAMSVGKSVVLNHLMNSCEQTQSSTVGKFICQRIYFILIFGDMSPKWL